MSLTRFSLAGLLLATAFFLSSTRAAELPMYIGTYTKPGQSQGVYLSRFDTETGALSAPELAVETVSPSFLVQHPTRPFLYAVNETGSGHVSAFAIGEGGKLRLLNEQSSRGDGPTHISIDGDGHHVLIANYDSGSIAVLPIAPDGSLLPAAAFVQHHGTGPNAQRQEGPHAHSIYVDRAGTHVYTCDLGLDKVFIYRYDPATGALAPAEPPFASTAPGAGPRHLAFGPGDDFVYCASELANTVTVFARAPGQPGLSSVQTLTTLPADFPGESGIAEVAIHPNHRFLYVSNRGHDTIATFAIAPDGRLSLLAHTPTRGSHPRYFGLDPSGQFLLVGNMLSDTISVNRLDPATGRLTPLGEPVHCYSPTCFVFAK